MIDDSKLKRIEDKDKLSKILISQYSIPFYLGGTSLLIVVVVGMDTIGQVQSHLFSYQYESLIKKSRLRGNRR